MKTLTGVMMKLIKSEICEETLDPTVGALLSQEMLMALYRLSKSHDLAHIVGSALDRAGLLPEGELAEKYRKQSFTAVYRHERMKYEYERICDTLSEAEIEFLPLKGSLIRAYYPEPWQRTSCDIDVLVHEEDLNRAMAVLVEKLGFDAEEKIEYHDVSLHSPSGIHLELHFNLKENMDNIDALLVRVWDYTIPVEGRRFERRQTNEYLIFQTLAHLSYHFVHGGCGLRPCMDLHLLKTKMGYDEETVRGYCRECGIETFYDRVCDLIKVWFEGAEYTATTENMLFYLLEGGVYGTQSNRIAAQQDRRGGKLGYVLHRIFMPYRDLKIMYPSLERHRWLLPVYWVRRWFRLLVRGRLKHSVKEFKTLQGLSKDKSGAVGALLRDLELQ